MTGQLSALAQGKAAGAPAGYTSKLLKTGQTTQYDSELVLVPFNYAEIWDGSVVMNLAIAGSVVLNKEVNEQVVMNREVTDSYSELENI